MQLKFYTPEKIFKDLKSEFGAKSVPELMTNLNKSSNKEKRELFYGSIFVTGLRHLTRHEYLIKTSGEEPGDVEMLNRAIWKQNQNLPKSKRQPDHWKIQNVLITETVLKEKIKRGIYNFYQIVAEHLTRTKLTNKKDYKGYH